MCRKEFSSGSKESIISINVIPSLPLLRINQSFLKGSKLCVFEGEM